MKWNRQDPNVLASSHMNEVLIWDRRVCRLCYIIFWGLSPLELFTNLLRRKVRFLLRE